MLLADKDGGRPARYVCPRCGVGDHLYTAASECVYCGKATVVDRLRWLINRLRGAR